MTFGLPRNSKIFAWVSGAIVTVFAVYRWFNQNGSIPDSLFTLTITIFGLLQLLKPFRAKLVLDRDHLSYCDGYVSMHSLKIKEIDFIKIYRPTKLAVHNRDGNAFAVDFVFDNIEQFYEIAKKLKIKMDMSEAQKAKQI